MILELLLVSAFGAVLGMLLNKMASKEFLDLFKKWNFDQTLLPQLEFAVLTVGAVLSYAEEKQITNPSVKLWFDAIKDAVYDAEDLLDEIIAKKDKKNAELKKEIESKVKEIIKRLEFIAQQKDVLALGGSTRLRFPSTSLVDKTKIFGRDNDKQVILRFLVLPVENVDEINVSVNEIPLVSIVGMPGIGKTTLAQLLFNDETVKEKFGVRAWVHVSEKFDILKITKIIYESLSAHLNDGDCHTEDLNTLLVRLQAKLEDKNSGDCHTEALNTLMARLQAKLEDKNSGDCHPEVLNTLLVRLQAKLEDKNSGDCHIEALNTLFVRLQTKLKDKNSGDCHTEDLNQVRLQAKLGDKNSGDCHTEDLNTLQVKLQAKLKDKKFLLVLDDIWNENFVDWDVLQRPFKGVNSQSRIIVTTRCRNVASAMRAAHIHHLPGLSGDDCWSIFNQYAFRPEILSKIPEMKEIGKKIVEKCNGLPLAAKTLGTLLYSKAEIDEWVGVLNSEIWELPTDKCSILETLRLSYNQLPSHLKPCFAYCSIFPKGYEFEKDHLIMLWMAEGLLQQPRSEQSLLEDVGNEYFDELLSRSFFQQMRDRQGKPYFKMNDVFSDLAQSVGGEFCFMSEKGIAHQVLSRVRYISFIVGKYDVSKRFDALKDANRLRTLLALKPRNDFGVHFLSPSASPWQKFSRLRVLSLQNYNISKLDDSISKLKYLRYLDLSSTVIEELDKHVCALYNLETLLLSRCKKLKTLHKNMKNLTNLQHLDISETEITKMPPGFGRLKNLHTLNAFVVGLPGDNTNCSHVNELKELSDLRTLSIRGLEKVQVVNNALGCNLKEKKYLRELFLHWKEYTQDQNQSERQVLHQLRQIAGVLGQLQPHKNLKKLTIENYYGIIFPNWLCNGSISKLVSLHLIGGNCSSLPPLGQLSSLKELHLVGMEAITTVGSEFCGRDSSSIQPFRSLEILKFEKMHSWSSIEVEEQFPCLEELQLCECRKLTGNLPKYIPLLKRLYISECPKLKLDFLHKPSNHHQYKALKSLDLINSCGFLNSFPLGYFTKLEKLQIQGCSKLDFLQLSHNDLTFLRELKIQSCANLEFSPAETQLIASNLEVLSVLNCNNVNSMPSQMQNLTSLQTLTISQCSKLVSFPTGGLPGSLKSLSIKKCNKQLKPQVEWGLRKMDSLASFEIEGECSGMESFPDEEMLPAALTSLHIGGFLNLTSLDHLGLKNFTFLKELDIQDCKELKCLSEKQLPLSIDCLNITECPLIKPRCQKGGNDWEKISHIPNINIQ